MLGYCLGIGLGLVAWSPWPSQPLKPGLGLINKGYLMRTQSLTRPDGRVFKIKTYTPEASSIGLVMITPGAGGSEDGYRYLANYFVAQGYWVVVMEHLESNLGSLRNYTKRQGLKQGLVEMVTHGPSYQGRMMEIQEVLRWLDGQVGGPKILVGHSMGAATVMIEAGAANKVGCSGQDRFDAYIALSPQGPGLIFPQGAWGGITKPMLLITGTEDHELDHTWESRLQSFDNMKAGTYKWLGVIEGATHMNLAGVGLSRNPEKCVVELVDLFCKNNLGKNQSQFITTPTITLRVK